MLNIQKNRSIASKNPVFYATVLVLISLSCVGCTTSLKNTPVQIESTAKPVVEVAMFETKRFALTLVAEGAECNVSIQDKRSSSKEAEISKLSIGSPCEFFRFAGSNDVLSYKYRRNDEDFAVVMVNGGVPTTEVSDKLLPNGCGSEFQAIRVYEDRVELARPVHADRKIFVGCPSGGLDEVIFSEFSF